MVRDDKVQVHFVISHNVMERFRHEVAVQHETITRGMISEEVERALNMFIAFHRAQRTQQQNTKVLQKDKQLLIDGLPPKVYQLREDISKYLIDSGLYEEVPEFINEKHLLQAISVLRGTDKRTINNWIGLLKEAKIIEEAGVHLYRFSASSYTDYEELEERNLAQEEGNKEQHQVPLVKGTRSGF